MMLIGAITAVWLSSAACQLGDGDCLRMSDCDTGYACVEGTCISDRPSDAPDASSDAGSTRADASASDASRDSSTGDAATDARTDDASADAS
ncbi:MAG: hypothetical protein BGO98_26385 [Myxococcales bacterium 68-20]|nr:hypothetical protein [Myxococcales bacterium]OJY30266.1 MAG: hypothetical protein BGO98_26385 [Myxococcales bacterium 68-20]